MRKGIVLAGGTATRLRPATQVVSKQLLPVFDKPLIYYPLTTLMLSGTREILVISSHDHLPAFQALLGNGAQWGISIRYAIQSEPRGLAEAPVIAKEFLQGNPFTLVLGDNFFYGSGLGGTLTELALSSGSSVTACQVSDPRAFGVVEFDSNNKVKEIIEKPKDPTSNWIVPGLYFLDSSAPERAALLQPSRRGELEIADLLNCYIEEGGLNVRKLGRGTAWFDMGTAESLLNASEFVRTVQKGQGLLIGSPEEVAWRQGWISDDELAKYASTFKSEYGATLRGLLEEGY